MDPNESVGALVVDPLRPNVVYAGSWRSGVYLSEDAGQSWRLLSEGLRTRSVRALAISADGETLYAATRGEGVFRLSTHDQAYFDALAPAPYPEAPATQDVDVPPAPSAPQDEDAPPTPVETPFGNPLCGGAAAIPLGLVLFGNWTRRTRRKDAH